MKIVIFGLSISSSWGNGHATLWRGLCAALARRGHSVVFLERDVPYYASNRDLTELPGTKVVLYPDWDSVSALARQELADAEIGLVTSYCPDATKAAEFVLNSKTQVKCFYDLDTPITLDRLEQGLPVDYISGRGLSDFDLVLSYSGGASLQKLKSLLGARVVAPLYGSVDPSVHSPVAARTEYKADLSYLGTWAAERQQRLEDLFVEPAKKRSDLRFLIGGSLYGESFPWQPNIYWKNHVSPSDHSAFYCSTHLNLNVTRRAMAENGYCPSGRLFEAAACGCATLSDSWAGLTEFFTPGKEILIAENSLEAMDALARSPEELRRIGKSARERTLAEHTADIRARQFEEALAFEAA